MFAVLQGIFFIQSVGALSIPDSDLHANSAYAFATGQILNPTYEETDQYGNQIKIQPITGDSIYLSRKGTQNALITDIIGNLAFVGSNVDPYKKNQESVNNDSNTIITVPQSSVGNRSNQYFPLIFLPQAIGVWIGIHTHAPPYTSWQLGRITNFIVYLLLFSLAIVLIPRGKFFLALIGCIPPTIFLASSLMADSLFISVSALFIALVFKAVGDNKAISRRIFISLVLLTVLLFFSKLVYVAEALLVLVLPRSILSTKRKIKFVGISMLISVPIYGLWSYFYAKTPAATNLQSNKDYIVHNTHQILRMIAKSIYYLYLRWKQLPPVFMYSSWAIIVATVIFIISTWYFSRYHAVAPKKHGFTTILGNLRYPLTAIIIAVVVLLLTYFSLLLTWTTLPPISYYAEIDGMQGRYLIPIIPLLLSLGFIGNSPFKTISSERDPLEETALPKHARSLQNIKIQKS